MKNKVKKILAATLIIGALSIGTTGCSSCSRMYVDLKSDISNGLDRTINVYTANGDLIATYSGKIDIDTNDGGYVKFDFEGKRYVYYNCFVETIADIN